MERSVPFYVGLPQFVIALCRRAFEGDGQIGKDITELRDTTVRDFFARARLFLRGVCGHERGAHLSPSETVIGFIYSVPKIRKVESQNGRSLMAKRRGRRRDNAMR